MGFGAIFSSSVSRCSKYAIFAAGVFAFVHSQYGIATRLKPVLGFNIQHLHFLLFFNYGLGFSVSCTRYAIFSALLLWSIPVEVVNKAETRVSWSIFCLASCVVLRYFLCFCVLCYVLCVMCFVSFVFCFVLCFI